MRAGLVPLPALDRLSAGGHRPSPPLTLGNSRPYLASPPNTLDRSGPGSFMAVGNCIPHNTPVENALYYNQVYEELCWR